MALRLGVSVSSYSDYRKCKYIKREVSKILLGENIKYYSGEYHKLSGSRRLSTELQRNGIRASHATVAMYMHQMGLRSEFYPKFSNTTNSKHSNPVVPNRLDCTFKVTGTNKAWVSDITYISVVGGFEYLTTIIDLFDRKVIGYRQSRTLKAKDTVIPALEMAIKRRLNGRVQYTCGEFTKFLKKYKMRQSNSRKGNCWDNAVAESFFKTIKCELVYRFKQLISTEKMKS